jgi:hypothetical protein
MKQAAKLYIPEDRILQLYTPVSVVLIKHNHHKPSLIFVNKPNSSKCINFLHLIVAAVVQTSPSSILFCLVSSVEFIPQALLTNFRVNQTKKFSKALRLLVEK